MLYMDLDTNLKKKLSGSISFHLRYCNLNDCDDDIIKDFLRYSLNEDTERGTYEYLDKKTFEFIELDDELVKDLVAVLKERLGKKRAKAIANGTAKIDKESEKVVKEQKGKVIKLFD